MSNKIQLQTNNTALDEYIVRINAAKEVAAGLPKAGGSSNENENLSYFFIYNNSNDMYSFFQFKEGINWIDFVETPYNKFCDQDANVRYLYLDGTEVLSSDLFLLRNEEGTVVNNSDLIITGHHYILT